MTVLVEVDLLVPASLVSGRRAARMPPHDNNAARQAEGLELALHDNDLLTVHGLGDGRRQFAVAVTGVAALLAAKAHKITDRLPGSRERLSAKDAADVYGSWSRPTPTSFPTASRPCSTTLRQPWRPASASACSPHCSVARAPPRPTSPSGAYSRRTQ